MKTININSNITINWKIWRGINKTSEEFAGSNLRVFLIGTENTYSVTPNVGEDSVLNIVIPQGALTTGAYDLKAIWEKNEGRTLMSSTRSNIFGITEAEEANPKDEVMQIVSYVESYGRDGLSAFEIAVLRGLNRGCSSEAEWINSLYAGGEGGGGGICTLGTDITIGGTALGDDLLNREGELEGHLKGNVLDSGTPLNLLFKVLLSKAKEIEQPNPVAVPGSVVNNPGTVSVQANYIGTRPKGHVEVKFTYEPIPPTVTPPSINGMRWGYATDVDGNDKHTGEDDVEIIGKYPTLSGRIENKVVLVTVDNGAEVTDNKDGTYSFIPKVGDNIIRVEYDEGNIHYEIEELHVWPLNSEYRVYSEEGVKVDRERSVLKCGPIYGTDNYPHPDPLPTNYVKVQGSASISECSISITDKADADVGKRATFKITGNYGTVSKTDSTIKNNGTINYGYKNHLNEGVIRRDDITKPVSTTLIESGSVVVKCNGVERQASLEGVYDFKVQEGDNTVEATIINPTYDVYAEGATIYPLNEDLETKESMSVDGIQQKIIGGDRDDDSWSFKKVLPAILRVIKAEETDYSDIKLDDVNDGYSPTASLNNKTVSAKAANTKNKPWHVILPNDNINNVMIWIWDPITNNGTWSPVSIEWTGPEDITHEGHPYKQYTCASSDLPEGDYLVKYKR